MGIDLTSINLEAVPIETLTKQSKRKRKKKENTCCASAKKNKKRKLSDEEFPADLNNVENWKNLAPKPSKLAGRENKIIINCPEILAAQERENVKQPKKKLLINGNMFDNFVKIRKNFDVQVQNTCSVDSVCQILVQGWIDYAHIRSLISGSNNKLMQVVASLATKGAVSCTYKQRAQALSEILRPSNLNTIGNCEKVTYNCYGNLGQRIAQLLGDDHPSLTREVACSICPPITFNEALLDVNYSVLLKKGVQSLARAVNKNSVRIEHCPACRADNPNVENTLNMKKIIFITTELLVEMHKRKKISERFIGLWEICLKDIPTKIMLERLDYNLIGVVAQRPGHYIGYRRRITGQWDECNDLAKNKRIKNNVTEKSVINPGVLIFVAAEC